VTGERAVRKVLVAAGGDGVTSDGDREPQCGEPLRVDQMPRRGARAHLHGVLQVDGVWDESRAICYDTPDEPDMAMTNSGYFTLVRMFPTCM
jgi:hypothetical protein